MMLEEYAITQNKKFLTDTLLPLADAVVTFYDRHWKRDAAGKILFDSAQSLETWQTATNPTPVIVGLKYVIEGLMALPAKFSTALQRGAWKKTLSDLPDIPEKQENGKSFLLPATVFGKLSNAENPELYAVFPYRIYGIGKDSLETGIRSFNARVNRENRCWWQDEIQAACLGLGREAANGIVKRMMNWNEAYRFPRCGDLTTTRFPILITELWGIWRCRICSCSQTETGCFFFPPGLHPGMYPLSCMRPREPLLKVICAMANCRSWSLARRKEKRIS
jgi:hypothetical protein